MGCPRTDWAEEPGLRAGHPRGGVNQIQTYKRDIPWSSCRTRSAWSPTLSEPRTGPFTAGWEHYAPWRTVDGSDLAPTNAPQLDVLIRGVFEHVTLPRPRAELRGLPDEPS